MREKLQEFLTQYIGRGTDKNDRVTELAVEDLVEMAELDGVEQEIIDYGTQNPEAPFWDFLNFLKPGLFGVTQEELIQDD